MLKKQKEGKNALQKPFLKKKSFTKRSPYLRDNGENGSEVRAYLIILVVLIPYFLCTTGVMYQMFGVPRSIILNSEGEQDYMYIHDQEIIAARWIGDHNRENQKDLKIYLDSEGSRRVALAYDVNKCPHVYRSFFAENTTVNEGYIYLRYINAVDGKICPWGREAVNITEYSHLFTGTSKIYNNGGSEIYRVNI